MSEAACTKWGESKLEVVQLIAMRLALGGPTQCNAASTQELSRPVGSASTPLRGVFCDNFDFSLLGLEVSFERSYLCRSCRAQFRIGGIPFCLIPARIKTDVVMGFSQGKVERAASCVTDIAF